MLSLERRDLETKTIRITVFESTGSENPLNLRAEELLQAFDDTGVILLRGFDFDLGNFEFFTRVLCDKFYTVSYRHKRGQLNGDRYSNEVFQGNFMLFGHTEGTFKPYPMSPEVCFFMCITPPAEQGGETTLVDGITFLKNMSPQLRRRFEDSGITYSMLWGPERWKNEFYVEDARTLAGLFAEIPGVKYSFHKESLELFYTTEAITKTRGGDHAFATGLLAHLPRISHPRYLDKKVHTNPANRVFFGDGEELSDEIINELIDIHDTLAYPHRWQAGDVLMIDNTRFMHGRTMTQRHCDRIIASRFGWLKPDS
ncbi:MAG TPA: TauD/TfdA family dioxygenase [Cyclobacteriaceae bacterium]